MYKILIILILVSCSQFDKVELKEIEVNSNSFYFKKYSRGLNYEIIAISRSKSKDEPIEKVDLISPSGRRFFYKIQNDSLIIFDGHFPDVVDLGIPIIINSKMKVSDVLKIKNDFLQNPNSEYNLFPESHKRILEKR